MLAFQIERLKHVRRVDDIVLATSSEPADDPVAEVGRSAGIRVVRGSEADVLGRYLQAAEESGADIIVRVAADNPLVDPKLVDRMVERFMAGGIDHLSSFEKHTYPFGVGCAVFSRAALQSISDTMDPQDREHVEPAMLRSESVRTAYMRAPDDLNRPEIMVTVDHPFELEKVRRIATALEKEKGIAFDTADIIRYLDAVRVMVFANSKVGYECLRHMLERGENLVGLVVQPPHQSSMRSEIIELAELPAKDVLSPDNLEDPGTLAWIRERRPDIITSFWSSFIVTDDVLAIPPRGVTNLHNSLLPLCRGAGANIWSILDRQPAGVTYHYIERAVDRGPIIAQRGVDLHSWDTGRTLQFRLEQALIDLFRDSWNAVRVGPVRTTPQVGEGTFHYRHEVDTLRQIDLNRQYSGRELIDLLRAFSFSPYEGCYFFDDAGNKVFMNLQLNRGLTTLKQASGKTKS
jgi:methionyl-tRNA formyltransferase